MHGALDLVDPLIRPAIPWTREEDLIALVRRMPDPAKPENARCVFPRAFLQWAYTTSDAPLAFGFGALFPLLATLCPKHLTIPGAPGGKVITPNFYTLLVGSSGARKSHVAAYPIEFLDAASATSRVMAAPQSHAYVAKTLNAEPHQMLFIPEFFSFLAQTQERRGGNHMTQLKADLIDAWDGQPIGRGTRDEVHHVRDVRWNLTAGTTIPYLTLHANPADFVGGFFARFFLMFAERERTNDDFTTSAEPMRLALVQWLNNIYLTPPESFGHCMGVHREAVNQWKDFKAALETAALTLGPKFDGIYTRVPTYALKMALLLDFGFGQGHPTRYRDYEAVGPEWVISPFSMGIACQVALRALLSVVAIVSGMEDTDYLKKRRAILESVDAAPAWTPWGVITKKAGVPWKEAKHILHTLAGEQMVEHVKLQSTTGSLDPSSGAALTGDIDFYRRPAVGSSTAGIEDALKAGHAFSDALIRVRGEREVREKKRAVPRAEPLAAAQAAEAAEAAEAAAAASGSGGAAVGGGEAAHNGKVHEVVPGVYVVVEGGKPRYSFNFHKAALAAAEGSLEDIDDVPVGGEDDGWDVLHVVEG